MEKIAVTVKDVTEETLETVLECVEVDMFMWMHLPATVKDGPTDVSGTIGNEENLQKLKSFAKKKGLEVKISKPEESMFDMLHKGIDIGKDAKTTDL